MKISRTMAALAASGMLAGAAFAQIGNGGSVTGQPPATPPTVEPQGFGGSNLGSAQLSVVINPAGAVIRGKGNAASGTARISAGRYLVRFTRNVASCTFIPAIGGVNQEAPLIGFITASKRAGDVNGVEVRTYSRDGIAADRSFHLYIDC